MYLNEWKDGGLGEMEIDFKIDDAALAGATVLLASYGQGCYEGDAFVLFERDGKLYEVNGGHCSCYGLEGQWEPEETTVEALRHRIEKGALGKAGCCDNEFANELRAVLDALGPNVELSGPEAGLSPEGPARTQGYASADNEDERTTS